MTTLKLGLMTLKQDKANYKVRKVMGLVKLLEGKRTQFKFDSLTKIAQHSFQVRQDVGISDQGMIEIESEVSSNFNELNFSTEKPRFSERQLDACENLAIAID